MNLLTIAALNLAFAVPTITPPEQLSSFDAAVLHEPTSISHRTDDGAARVQATAEVLATKLSHGDRRRLGAKVLSPRRVAIVKAASPNADVIVTVNVDLKNRDPEAPAKFISAAFTLDAAGQVQTMLVPPKMRTERVELLALGDVDGDGADDFVLAHGTEDAPTLHLIVWDGHAAVDHVVHAAGVATAPTPTSTRAPVAARRREGGSHSPR